MSEHQRRPLYRLDVSELGYTPEKVETGLRQALELCARWNAILLIDEADVFLERRSSDNLKRNELVSSKKLSLDSSNLILSYLTEFYSLPAAA